MDANSEFEKITEFQGVYDELISTYTKMYLDKGLSQESANSWAKHMVDATIRYVSEEVNKGRSAEEVLEEWSRGVKTDRSEEAKAGGRSKIRKGEPTEPQRAMAPEGSTRKGEREELWETEEYVTRLVRESIGVEDPDAPEPPDFAYEQVTSDQINRMPYDQLVRYCLNALRYGAARIAQEAFDHEDSTPEERGTTEVRAKAKALLVVDEALRKARIPDRLSELDRYTLEELFKERCSLETARRRGVLALTTAIVPPTEVERRRSRSPSRPRPSSSRGALDGFWVWLLGAYWLGQHNQKQQAQRQQNEPDLWKYPYTMDGRRWNPYTRRYERRKY